MKIECAVVQDYMTPLPHSIGSEQSLEKAKEMMDRYRCRHLPVKHGGKLTGIISQSDLALLESRDEFSRLRVEDIMTDDVFQTSPTTTLRDIAAQFAERHLSSALIVRGSQELLGIFTWIDLAKAFVRLSDQGDA